MTLLQFGKDIIIDDSIDIMFECIGRGFFLRKPEYYGIAKLETLLIEEGRRHDSYNSRLKLSEIKALS